MKKIIINGDDFGLSSSINRGIIRAHREGILTSASLMVNMPGFEGAARLSKENPTLDLGVHINIYRGRPVLDHCKTKTLTDKNGFFLGDIFKIVGRICSKCMDFTELEAECDAQIRKALDNNLKITHLDSEKHLHLIFPFYRIIAKLAQKYGISKIRKLNEFPYLFCPISRSRNIIKPRFIKTLILQLCSEYTKKVNLINSIKPTDYSFGLLDTGIMTTDKYVNLFSYLRDGLTEIMCHPGEEISVQKKGSIISKQDDRDYGMFRQQELSALLDARLKDLMKKLDIDLTNFKNE